MTIRVLDPRLDPEREPLALAFRVPFLQQGHGCSIPMKCSERKRAPTNGN